MTEANECAQTTGTVAHRLSSYKFTDLYIGLGRDRPYLVRSLQPKDNDGFRFAEGLEAVPKILMEDVRNLFNGLLQTWKNSDYHREFTLDYDGAHYRCALIARPGLDGRKIVEDQRLDEVSWCIRQIAPELPTFDDLNAPRWIRSETSSLLLERGLVLVSGPFASGKTTLASCIFDTWVETSGEVGIAIEDPPELDLERRSRNSGAVFQVDLRDEPMKQAIRNARRWSPRYFFVGEVRDPLAASELLHMAISGPLAICTIHASDPVQALASLFRFASGAMTEDAAYDAIASSVRQIFHTEIRAGKVDISSARIRGEGAALIKSKIKTGNFSGLYEDFHRQKINRNKPQ